jgi:hypothetical protein
MADEKKSFSDLLSEAPLAANEDTISLVGALARSNQPGKFVLATGSGNSLTLDVAAVKGHQVIGGGVGQLLVQVDVDRAQVPESAQQAIQKSGGGVLQSGLPDVKHPTYDFKHPVLDKYPWEEPVRTNPETDLRPFALATEQQAPPSALAAMEASPVSNFKTFFSWDINTPYSLDNNTGHWDVHKNPILDATGRPPYLD